MGLRRSWRGEPAGDAEPGEPEPLALSENHEKGRNGDPEGRPGPSAASLGTQQCQGLSSGCPQAVPRAVPHLLPMDRRLLLFSLRLFPEDARRRVTLGTGVVT